MQERGIVPGLEAIRQEQTQGDRLGVRPDPREGVPRRVAMRPVPDGRGHLGIAQQPIGADKGQRGSGIAPGHAGELLGEFGAGLRVIARADGPGGDDHPLVHRIVVEHHGVCQKVPRGLQRVSERWSPRLSLLHTRPYFLVSHPTWAGETRGVPPGEHADNGYQWRDQATSGGVGGPASGRHSAMRLLFILPDLVGVTCAGALPCARTPFFPHLFTYAGAALAYPMPRAGYQGAAAFPPAVPRRGLSPGQAPPSRTPYRELASP